MSAVIAFLSTLFPILPAVVGGVSTIVAAVIGFLKWQGEHKRVIDLSKRVIDLSTDVGTLRQQLSQTVAERDQALATLTKEGVTHALTLKDMSDRMDALAAENLMLQGEVDKRDMSLRHQGNLAKKMLGMEGEFWKTKAQTNKPLFIPIEERTARNTVIFSVMNLKGGVGKTTLTANLGAAMAATGRQVLFIDVDLQGSLTSLFLPFEKINALYADNLLHRDFLTTISAPGPVNLLPYMQTVFDDGHCALVPTSDHLAYADMNLMMTWMLRVAKRDSRFLLRRGLHQKRIFSKFDVVLIDCPPILNTSCINALAASDFVVIPVTPSENAVDRVPQLVKTLKHSIASLNPYLAVAGLVFNQTQKTQLSTAEQAFWSSVVKRATDQCGSPVRGFHTCVRNMKEIRETEGDFAQPKPGSERYEVFRALADELLEVVPRASHHVG